MTAESILRLDKVGKKYRSGDSQIEVLREITLSLVSGDICALVGPSGSGKTSLLGICAGLDRPSSGSVLLAETEMTSLSEQDLARLRNRFVGFVFQSFQLIPTLTALENVMVPGELGGNTDVRKSAEELLDRVGLSGRSHHYPVQLSGGEQQRVALARAFINKPAILFADEPTGNLDADTAETVEGLLFELHREAGTTLVIATHNLELAKKANRMFRIDHGELVESSNDSQENS